MDKRVREKTNIDRQIDINQLSHQQMAEIMYFTPNNHTYRTAPYRAMFDARFKMLGGMTNKLKQELQAY